MDILCWGSHFSSPDKGIAPNALSPPTPLGVKPLFFNSEREDNRWQIIESIIPQNLYFLDHQVKQDDNRQEELKGMPCRETQDRKIALSTLSFDLVD
jgi:hypothetical protein